MITDDTVYSDTVRIQAPADFVWQVLVNFSEYGNWNTFCPSVENAALAVGEVVDMQVDLGNGLQQQIETIEVIEAPYKIAWGMIMESEDQLRALRTQTLMPINESSCDYVSEDAFTGALTAMIIEHMGQAIEAGFNRCAYGLKDYAESLYLQQCAND